MQTQLTAAAALSTGSTASRRAGRAFLPTVISVRAIESSRHLDFLLHQAAPEQVSFLQWPAWAGVKSAWRAESLGWFDAADPAALLGTALVLYRDLPALPLLRRRSLAYIPEGPTVPWFEGRGPAQWLEPLLAYLRAAGVCSVKLGPKVVGRRWSAATVKAGMAEPGITDFAALAADAASPDAERLVDELRALGWRRHAQAGGGLADQQPRHFLQIGLTGRTEEELFAGFNTQWRRNVRAAERAGVEVWQAGAEALPVFHELYLATARRDGFTPRPLPYFELMFRELRAGSPGGIRLYLAGRDGRASAAATLVRFGERAWFGYGASADTQRELRASNAVQWRMLRDCLADGLAHYDLRGVGSTLDPAHPMFGLLRFKVGTGGEVVEYPGEYDYALEPRLDRLLRYYLGTRRR